MFLVLHGACGTQLTAISGASSILVPVSLSVLPVSLPDSLLVLSVTLVSVVPPSSLV